MNSSSDSDNRQDECTSLRFRLDNEILAATQNTDNTDNRVYLTPYSERKEKSPKGFNGLSPKEKELIDLSIYKFTSEYGLNNCQWLTFTFDEYSNNVKTSDEALINLLENYSRLIKSIQYHLRQRIYKQDEIKPYLIVTGLRRRTSYGRDIPCLDINVICVVKDKEGNELFNVDEFVEDVYASASRLAEEVIKRPLDFRCRTPNNTSENRKELANYLKIYQVTSDLLEHFQKSEHASLIPNSYVYVHKSLKDTFQDRKYKYPGSVASEHRELMEDEFSEDVIIYDDQDWNRKFAARLINRSQEEFLDKYNKKYYEKYPDRLKADNEIVTDDTDSDLSC